MREWNWTLISYNTKMDTVRKHNNIPWDLYALSQKNDLTINDIDNLILPNAIGKWNWNHISWSISSNEVKKYPEKPWNLYYLSKNPTMIGINDLVLPNAKTYDRRIFLFKNKPYKKAIVREYHSNLEQIADLTGNKDEDILSSYLCFNPKLTVEYIKNHPSNIWDWNTISKNINIDEVRNNPDMPWCKDGLSHQSELTIEDINLINLYSVH